MSDELNSLTIRNPTLFTQTREFRIFLEPFIPLLRDNQETERVEYSPETRYLYNFSLESFLLSKGIGLEDISIIMRVNKIDNSHSIDPTIDHLLIPSENQLSNIKSIYKNRTNK